MKYINIETGEEITYEQTLKSVYEKEENGVVYFSNVISLEELRIAELKVLLSSTDYKAIKYAEGVLTEQEYLPIKEQRENWRKEINELEVLLNKEPRIYI